MCVRGSPCRHTHAQAIALSVIMINDIDDLENLSNDELDRRLKMLSITKLQQEIQQSHEINMATIEKMRTENDKFRAETAKISKETKFYPMLTFTMGTVAVIGGVVAALITKLL